MAWIWKRTIRYFFRRLHLNLLTVFWFLTSCHWRRVSWTWWSCFKHQNSSYLNFLVVRSDHFEQINYHWALFKQYFLLSFFDLMLNRQSLSQGLLFPWNVFWVFFRVFFSFSFLSIPWKISYRLKEWLCVPGILLSVSTQMHWIACTAAHEMPFWPMPSATHPFHLDGVPRSTIGPKTIYHLFACSGINKIIN